MQDTLVLIAGCFVILVPCAWAAWHLAKEIRSRLQSGTAVDSTSSKVYKEDAPGMFWMQIAGLSLLAGFCTLVVISLVAVLLLHVVSRS